MTVTPWKYEDQMSFLCSFMESRNTSTNIVSPPGSVSPSRSALESPPASPYHRSESQCSTRSSTSTRQNTGKAGMQEIYELMKSSNDLRIQKQNTGREVEMDENDLFFLSMSKAVKSLSILEQTKIKLDLHSAVSQAQIRKLEKQQTNTVLQTPINITYYKIIPPQQTKSQFQVSPPYQECQQSLRSSTHSSIDYHPTALTSNTISLPSTSSSNTSQPQQIGPLADQNLVTYYSSVDYSDCE